MTSRKDGKKIATRPDERALPAVGRWSHSRAEIGSEGEERSGHSLGGAIARKKRIIADPTARDHGGLKQRQHDVSTAEHERSGPIECVDQLKGLRRERGRKQRKTDQKREQEREQQSACAPSQRERQHVIAWGRFGGQEQRSRRPTEDDHQHLNES